jgi:hypothetical protein
MKYLKIAIALIFALYTQQGFAQGTKNNFPDYLQPDHAVNAVTMVMVHDVVGPPIAARYYAYVTLSAYNIVAANNKTIPPLQKFIKEYKANTALDTIKYKYDYKIAAYYSILETAKLMLPSGFMLKDDQDAFLQLLRKTNVDTNIIKQSVKVAEIASKVVIGFSKSDHYSKLSALKTIYAYKRRKQMVPYPSGLYGSLGT